MNVIQLENGTGKTVLAIRQSLTKKYPLVVPTERDRVKVNGLIKSLLETGDYSFTEAEVKRLNILTWREFIMKLSSGDINPEGVVIDDFDKIMETRFHINPNNITITTK